MFISIIKSFLFVLSIVVITVIVAITFGRGLDSYFGLRTFQSVGTMIFGGVLLLTGATLRFWATLLFYQNKLNVISMRAQRILITTGPYKFSRNPLEVAQVCMAFGVSFIFGSPSAILLSIANFFVWDFLIRLIEEKQLQTAFGGEWEEYKKRVRRWL